MENKLNKEAIKEWIKDLRSGQYKQSTGVLKKEEGYCCLGVACETYKKLTGRGVWENGDFVIYGIDDSYIEDRNSAVLPEVVRNFFGFKENNPFLFFNIFNRSCTTCNDKFLYDFNLIADLIEKRFLKE